MEAKPILVASLFVLLLVQQQAVGNQIPNDANLADIGPSYRQSGDQFSGTQQPSLDRQLIRLPLVSHGVSCHPPGCSCASCCGDISRHPPGCRCVNCCGDISCHPPGCRCVNCCGDIFCHPPGCGCASCCPWACRTYTWRYFYEGLFLRPRNSSVPFAVGIDGPIVPPPDNNPIQVTPIAVADLNYEPGGRVGFSRALDECSSLGATYTHFESRNLQEISIAAPDVIRSLVSHPSSLSASTDFLYGRANCGIDFQLADVEYRRVFSCGELHSMSYMAAARYAHLTQDFDAYFESLGTETVTTGIEFQGGGLRVGWEGERHARKCGLMIYGRATASLLAGEFQAKYLQVESFDPTVVDTGWGAGQIITMLDLELGAGWASPSGRHRFTAGYIIQGWFNTVTTDGWIAAVQSNDFVAPGDTLTFDGLTARAEFRF